MKVSFNGESFAETIELYVAPQGELSGDGLDGLTGFIAAGGNWIVGLIVLIIIVAVILIYFGYKRFRKKRYEEHIYGERETPKPPEFRPYEPPSGMMKGSVGSVSRPETRQPEERTVDINRLIPAKINRYSDLSYFPKQGNDFPERQTRGRIFK